MSKKGCTAVRCIDMLFFFLSPGALTKRRLETSQRDAETRYQSHCDENNNKKSTSEELVVVFILKKEVKVSACAASRGQKKATSAKGASHSWWGVPGAPPTRVKVQGQLAPARASTPPPYTPHSQKKVRRVIPPKKVKASDCERNEKTKITTTTRLPTHLHRATLFFWGAPPNHSQPRVH